MTAPTLTDEDLMFDLDLRIVPSEEKRDLVPRAETRAENGCIGTPGSIRPCTYGCPTYVTCTRCL
jgi:hypothetical protein